ncbi:MAG: acyl-CoA dehydrogenase family protein [Pseudomonadales bacterium]
MSNTASDLDTFRAEARAYMEQHCPPSMRNRAVHFEDAFEVYDTDDARSWQQAMAERGWTAPLWPKEYGGGGLDKAHLRVLLQEQAEMKALPPAVGMGLAMIGPTLLEYGTEAQRQRHLPSITSGQVRWCQGYSEPGSGSDLASLQTKAVDNGDHYVINGQRVWTTGADHADWMFVLTRTDPAAPKHDGISFMLIDMHQPGVTVKPIPLISGSSPFCETFFDDAIARKEDLIGKENQGWTIAKRLLQYERSVNTDAAARKKPGAAKVEKPKQNNVYARVASDYAALAEDPGLRREVLEQSMQERAYALTIRRAGEESKSGGAPGAATSIFKFVGSTLARDGAALRARIRGTQGLGWEGAGFSDAELEATRSWLRDRAVTIYGGTNEVQLNIIAKRVLGLPD